MFCLCLLSESDLLRDSQNTASTPLRCCNSAPPCDHRPVPHIEMGHSRARRPPHLPAMGSDPRHGQARLRLAERDRPARVGLRPSSCSRRAPARTSGYGAAGQAAFCHVAPCVPVPAQPADARSSVDAHPLRTDGRDLRPARHAGQDQARLLGHVHRLRHRRIRRSWSPSQRTGLCRFPVRG